MVLCQAPDELSYLDDLLGVQPHGGLIQADDLVKLGALDTLVYELQGSDKLQIFQDSHIHIEGRLLRQIADILFSLVGLRQDIVTVDEYLALGRSEIACHDVHRGGFPGAVRPRKPVYLSFFDGEIQVVHGHVRAVVLHQIPDFDQSDTSFGLRFCPHCRERMCRKCDQRLKNVWACPLTGWRFLAYNAPMHERAQAKKSNMSLSVLFFW